MSDYVSVTDPASEQEAVQRLREIASRQQAAAAHLRQRQEAAQAAEAAELQARQAAIAERVREMIAAAVPEDVRTRDPRRIMTTVARRFGLSLGDITGASRDLHVMRARWAAIYEVHTAHPDLTIRQLGRHFGGRDHSSIRNALRKMCRDGVPQPLANPNMEAVR